VKNIYVGNLAYSANEDDLSALFGNYGQVERVHIVRDRETGQPRGFAFVEMPNDEEGDSAIRALNGTDLQGRTISVNEARPKPAGGGGRESRGGGGGRGFGRRSW
jgi:RNA recognition motif-containing protein